MDEVLDEALGRLQATGPEFGGGLSNHGPMVCEALLRLGRAGDVEGWLDGYVERLEPSPGPGSRLGEEWRAALGDPRRYPDLLATLRTEVSERPWTEVVGLWAARLLPGVSAAALHGIIRTAHAVRALEEVETVERRSELASGLAYWGACYEELPGTPAPAGTRGVADALAGLPRLAPERRVNGLISDDLRQVADVDGFVEAVDALAPRPDVPGALSELTRVMAGWYLANAEAHPIDFVHGVTGPSALRLLLPYLPDAGHAGAFAYVWQVCCALCSTCADFTPAVAGHPVAGDDDEVVDRAVAGGGAHAIKLVEACRREDAISADPVYRAAAADGAGRMRY